MQRADGSWLSRLSPGVPARRVNSLNVFDPQDDDRLAARLAETQALYARHDLVFHLRHTPLTPPALTAHVDAMGWLSAGETDVWTRPVPDAETAPEHVRAPGLEISDCSLADWLDAFVRVGGTRPETVAPDAVEQLGAALARIARQAGLSGGTRGQRRAGPPARLPHRLAAGGREGQAIKWVKPERPCRNNNGTRQMTAISKSLRDGSDRVAVLFDRFARDEAGSTAIEYTMMVGFISFAIITSLTAIGRVIDEDVFSVIVAAAAAM
eukprot:jgi/Tetstr1/431414/TSEL_002066.t1